MFCGKGHTESKYNCLTNREIPSCTGCQMQEPLDGGTVGKHLRQHPSVPQPWAEAGRENRPGATCHFLALLTTKSLPTGQLGAQIFNSGEHQAFLLLPRALSRGNFSTQLYKRPKTELRHGNSLCHRQHPLTFTPGLALIISPIPHKDTPIFISTVIYNCQSSNTSI